jgi:hypothetical protein
MPRRTFTLVFVCLTAFLTGTTFAKTPEAFQAGELVQMDSVPCGAGENKLQAGELVCREYVLQTDQVVYRIRETNRSRAALMPIGSRAEFRLDKNRMMLRIEGVDSKQRAFTVTTMRPRGESTADVTTVHLNHLQ